MRADLGLVGLDDEIERLGIDVALLGQDGFQRPHPKLHLGQFRAVIVVVVAVVVMVMIVVFVAGHGNLLRQSSAHCVMVRESG